MKCSHCGFENKNNAKFCTKCGNPLNALEPSISDKTNNSKYIIIALVAIVIVLVGALGFFIGNNQLQSDDSPQESANAQEVESVDNSIEESDDSDDATTNTISSSKSATKDWVSIGSYSGSGSGSQTITVPAGKIKVELSAYPILNYATNHLYVSGSNDVSGGVDWGPKSDVETRYDSFTYTSSSEEVFTIDYYETVSWNVEFFRYQ